ncbi:hypothetical protein ACGFI9_06195 [Micromonospora sp. NPDC048930]|uniref:hypothetical protein n=1 Tax=Micromonospora sp. NPDC048930 TaxID=3364261 RepID=UPI0037218FA0
MRDDTFVELLARDLRDVRWPEPAEIRATARRRSRRTAIAAAAAVLAVASVSAVLVGRAQAPAPSPAASVGGHAEIPTEAMLDPADVPVSSDERLGDTGLGERVRVDDVLAGCGRDQGVSPAPAESRFSRSQTLIGTQAVDGFATHRSPVISQDVYRSASADAVFTDLDRLVAACASWRQANTVQRDGGPVTLTFVHGWSVAARDFAGDRSALLRHTVTQLTDSATGGPAQFPMAAEYTLVVRVGDLVTVLRPGEPLRPGVPGSTVTEARLLDVGRAAADRMCLAANPGC